MLITRSKRGQSLIEYAALVSAAIFGVMAAAHLSYESFVGHAQRSERWFTVF